MRSEILIGITTVFLVASSGRATLYTETFNSGSSVGAIADGNPIPTAFSGTVSDITSGSTVGQLTVSLNISGGYNGDLYAYLVAPNGTIITLLNRPGSAPFYAAGAGFGNGSVNSFVLESGNGNLSIQTAGETTGVAMMGNFSAAGDLGGFSGSLADGTWTLYFADEVAGGGTSTLNNWSLNITAVPEPVNTALGCFGGLCGIWAVIRFRRRTLRVGG